MMGLGASAAACIGPFCAPIAVLLTELSFILPKGLCGTFGGSGSLPMSIYTLLRILLVIFMLKTCSSL